MEWEYHQDGITIPSRWFGNTILMELTESGRWTKSRGRRAHYVPRVKDSNKREVAFSLSNFPIAFRASLVVSFSPLEGVAFRGCEGGAGGLDFQS